jgi:hypothetical protein
LLKWLVLPKTRNIDDIDVPAVTVLYGRIIERKGFLKKLCTDFYKELLHLGRANKDKVIVELGGGGGFMKEVIPGAITSDILELPSVDRVFSACEMSFDAAAEDVFAELRKRKDAWG